MKKFSAVEWQSFSLKKDIEVISKKIKNSNAIQLSFFTEISLVVFGAAFANIFSHSENITKFWIVISVLSFIPALFLIGKALYQKHIEKRPGNDMVKPKDFIDSFDNSICYYVLMSESYYSMLIDITQGINNVSTDVQRFYYIEASYYMNKAIAELSPISKIADKVLTRDTNNIVEKRFISIARYHNLKNLLESIYSYLKNQQSIIESLKEGHIIIQTNEEYSQQLEIIDQTISKTFNCNK